VAIDHVIVNSDRPQEASYIPDVGYVHQKKADLFVQLVELELFRRSGRVGPLLMDGLVEGGVDQPSLVSTGDALGFRAQRNRLLLSLGISSAGRRGQAMLQEPFPHRVIRADQMIRRLAHRAKEHRVTNRQLFVHEEVTDVLQDRELVQFPKKDLLHHRV